MKVSGFPGYRFEASEPDAPRLFAPDGTVVARFGFLWREIDVQKATAEHADSVSDKVSGGGSADAGDAGGDEPDDEDFGPTDWSDPDLKAFALDHLEEQFAEARYLEMRPPPVAEYVRWHAAAVPELNEPEMPEDVQAELWMRLAAAAIRIALGDRTYPFWRDLDTPEKKRAARERRRVSRESSVRWRDSGFTDGGAFEEMSAAIEGIHAEREVSAGT